MGCRPSQRCRDAALKQYPAETLRIMCFNDWYGTRIEASLQCRSPSYLLLFLGLTGPCSPWPHRRLHLTDISLLSCNRSPRDITKLVRKASRPQQSLRRSQSHIGINRLLAAVSQPQVYRTRIGRSSPPAFNRSMSFRTTHPRPTWLSSRWLPTFRPYPRLCIRRRICILKLVR